MKLFLTCLLSAIFAQDPTTITSVATSLVAVPIVSTTVDTVATMGGASETTASTNPTATGILSAGNSLSLSLATLLLILVLNIL
jgi:hypothetical protein